MAIKNDIKGLIDSKANLGPSGVDSMFRYVYGRAASASEKQYWANKTYDFLFSKMEPNAKNFRYTPYFKDVYQSGDNTSNVTDEATIRSEFNRIFFRSPEPVEISLYRTLPIEKLREDLTAEMNKRAEEYSNFIPKGDELIIRFTDEPTPGDNIDDTSTIWHYNMNDKTYTPFASIGAMENYYKRPWAEIVPEINNVTTSLLDSENFQGDFVQSASAIRDDGTLPTDIKYVGERKFGPPNEAIALSEIYGQDKQAYEQELSASRLIGSVVTASALGGDLSQSSLDRLKDSTLLAKYTNAFLYGGYSIDDIFRDLKGKELYDSGDQSYKNFSAVSATQPAAEFYNTTEGQNSRSNIDVAPDLSLTNMDAGLFNNPIFDIPAEAFSTIVEPIDITSPEFKAEADKIIASWYDIQMKQNNATNEQEKAIADEDYRVFTDMLNKKYGLSLSNNANEAWGQLQELGAGFDKAGIRDSGLFEEAEDKYLQNVRETDQLQREQKISDEDAAKRTFLMNNASADELKTFINANPDKAKAWGLVPSDDIRNFYNKENLRKQYPDMEDSEIDATINTMLDENGNYRSTLYKNLYTNKYNLGQQKQTYQQEKLLEQKTREEEKAYAPYTTDENPFSSYKPSTPQAKITAPVTTPKAQTPVAKTVVAPKVNNDPGTYISNPKDLAGRKESDLIRQNGKIYLKPKNSLGTYVSKPEYLSKYKESELNRQNGKIYLKSGIKQRW